VEPLKVTARVVDAGGNPTGVPTRLIVSLGSGAGARVLPDAVLEWQQTGDGYAGRVIVPQQRAGRKELELRVLATGSLQGTRVVALRAGPPKSVRIEPAEDLIADGRRQAVRVSFLDAHGNRAEDPDAPPSVTAERGAVTALARTSSGSYEAEYRSVMSAADYREVLRAQLGPLSGQTEVRVRALGAAVVLGAKGGYSLARGGSGTPAGAVELGFWTRPLAASFGVVGEARWSGFARTDTVQAGTFPLKLENRATFVGLRGTGAWRRPLLSGMAWLGAGGGYVRGWSKTSIAGQPSVGGVGWAPTLHASAGWGPRLGSGVPFAEVEAGWQGGLSTGPLRGSFESVTINVGYRFDAF
jgi:hypothetical protein